MRIVVDNKYSYDTDLKVKKGDVVTLPTPSWLRDVKGDTWDGTVTSTKSTYDGWCETVISVKTP